MRYSILAAMAVLGLASGAQAMGQAATVVRDGDAALTCQQMANEAAELSASMGQGEGGLLGRVGGVAKAGAAMLVPGAGLALAGADAVTAPGRERREAATDARRDRWNYLNGLYAGKGCGPDGDGSVAQAATTPTPAPAPVVAAVATSAPAAGPSAPRIAPAPLASPAQALSAAPTMAEQARNESGPNQ